MIKKLYGSRLFRVEYSAIAVLVFMCGVVLGDIPASKEYTNVMGMKFVRIEPGSFQMGETSVPLPDELSNPKGADTNGDFDEHPVHNVTISKAFYMGMHEVTNLQYELFDPGHNKLRQISGACKDDDSPVVQVTWYQAQSFCRWLSDKDGRSYRLPTEAEWEYTCRAGTTSPFSTGVELPAELAQHISGPVKVGQTPANPWGLHDMHGGIEEWCRDWYAPYIADDQKNPVGPAKGDFKVTR